MGHKHYPPELRAAVMAALLSGQGVSEVAREYDVPTSTVSRWKDRARARVRDANAIEDPDEIGILLLRFLRSGLEALDAQHKLVGDEEWLVQQGASEVAVLHGVTFDKVFRVLEAMDPDELRERFVQNPALRNRVADAVKDLGPSWPGGPQR